MAATTEASPPAFGTVLVARSPQDAPSPLELQMRSCSTRLRVVQKLNGGAQYLLPGLSDATIAIRAFFPNNLPVDNSLVAFRNAYMYPICFFVLPPGIVQQEQLNDPHSCLCKAQLIMNNKDGTAATTGQQKEGSARVFVVPDVASAVTILSSLVQTLKPKRRDLKRRYLDSIKTNNFVGQKATPQVVSTHTARAFSNFCTRFELPVGEDTLLMSRMKNIANIGTADLSSLPIYDSTKKTLSTFYGSQQQQQQQQQRRPVTHGGMNRQPRLMNDGRMQESFESQDVYNRAMNGGPFPNRRHQTEPPFESPLRDSVAPLDNNAMMSATPQLIHQQFVPRQAQHGIPAAAPRAMAANSRAGQKRQRLLYQTNVDQMGNAIRPMSAYSSVSNL